MLADILARCTRLSVSYGHKGDAIRHGHIYVAPPARHLVVASPGFLDLETGPKVQYCRPAADRLFQSAAAIYGSRVIGVVLTGGGSDGTAGLQAIKSAGGIAIIQNPREARAPGMPVSALMGNHPDISASLTEIGPLSDPIGERPRVRPQSRRTRLNLSAALPCAVAADAH